MPLLRSLSRKPSGQREVREVEKCATKEFQQDKKNINCALGDLSKAEETHNKIITSVYKAHDTLGRSVQKEHKAAQALHKAVQIHEVAVAQTKGAEKTEQMHKEYASRIEQDLEQKRQRLDQLREQKAHNDQSRDSKLSEIRHAVFADTTC